ncbi:DNA-3-methyladenine glycosylase family protein [Dyadobacter aurulentus]|uniref:DNA-3-methyladenine glycosylase family protein n=1 Tax=Dyadobacter sp. UC 10 TaxID=2605428 RepID=UPI0011F0E891|nr:DNA glycosylase [Dyadobacter sp. UC 10]KAA0993222.1 DNA-3-methyladenine glycosylase 2 family protein [Dyadobacter sp. UC 10]
MINSNSILVPIPALFSFQECVWFLNRNYDDCLHEIREGDVYKALEVNGQMLLIRISENGAFLEIELLEGDIDEEGKANLVAYVREWFDMDNPIQPFYDLLQSDGRLAYMTESYKGLRLIGISNLFEAICWSIIGQQINLSFAYKVKRALVEKFGNKITRGGQSYYVFPEPGLLAEVSKEELKAIQFSSQKADYMIGIARAFASGTLSKELIVSLPDFEARKKALTVHKGIGVWTANYALMKSLREPQGIPYGDIGLLNALANHNIIQDRKELGKIDALFSQYAGWESYLVFYLWRSLTVRDSA